MTDKHHFDRRTFLRFLLALPVTGAALALSGCDAQPTPPPAAATASPAATPTTAAPTATASAAAEAWLRRINLLG